MAAFAVRKLIDERAHKPMGDVEVRAGLFETPVVVGDAARAAIGVGVGKVFRPGVKSVGEKSAAITPLQPDGGAVVRIVPEIGIKLNLSKLRVRFEILNVAADVIQRGVIGSYVERNRIDVPVVQQPDGG